jgi:tRNA threonylcarbamoyl adenosine modification protein (Sua5/YciO/YrdC/YwlC family)
MQNVWPGTVTIVLEGKGVLPKELGAADTIGIRVPDSELLQALLDQVGGPIVQTSVNLAGEPHLSDPKEIMSLFDGTEHAPAAIINAGILPEANPSKVIDLTQEESVVLRV